MLDSVKTMFVFKNEYFRLDKDLPLKGKPDKWAKPNPVEPNDFE